MAHDPISAAHASDYTPDQVTPLDLKLVRKEHKLLIKWRDGYEVVYPLAWLRKNCPCATCRTDRETRSTQLLPILKSAPTELACINAQLVGNYALQLYWSDGHNTGIFDFKYLRSLDPAIHSDAAIG